MQHEAERISAVDAHGRAKAAIELPAGLPAFLAGLDLHHAFVAFDLAAGLTFASVPATLTLLP